MQCVRTRLSDKNHYGRGSILAYMKLDEIYLPIEAPLDRVRQVLAAEMEQAIERGRSGTGDRFTQKAITYLLQKQGKQLRPALVLFSARSLGSAITAAIIQIAAVIELIHSASLVHDDIIDEAENRRAVLSVHTKYGAKIAILVGDVLFTQAFSIVAELPRVDSDTKVRLFSILTNTAKRMCYGEIFEQKVLADSKTINREDYLRILEFKTALLMSTASRCGAILAGADEEQESLLTSYGLNFGYAYQLVDDFKDRDSIFTGDLDLVAMAVEYVAETLVELDKLGDTDITRSMTRLAEFILPE